MNTDMPSPSSDI